MGSPPAVTLAAVHEGYLAVLIVLCAVQFAYWLSRVSALQNDFAESERQRLSLQQDLTELQKDHESLKIEASYDSLTGLPNRRSFEEKLRAVLEDLDAQDQRCALLMIDVDHFKVINDTFGHQAGDEVLKSLASHVQESLSIWDRGTGVQCARYGGDEFSVILPGFGAAEAEQFAEELRSGVESAVQEFQGIRCPQTISIGTASSPEHTSNPASLLELADQALYRAKTSGRNCVCRPSGRSDIEVKI